MNGKELKFILPIAVVLVILLSIIGIALMNGNDNNTGKKKEAFELLLGPVTDVNGQAVEMASMELSYRDEVVLTVVTNATGKALIVFDEKPVLGIYLLKIMKTDYETRAVNITLGFSQGRITISGINMEMGIELSPVKLPPVGFSAGPVTNGVGALEGALVELRYSGALIINGTTDANGMVEFSFQEPPKDGDYKIIISYEGFDMMEIFVKFLYDADSHTFQVTGDLVNVSLAITEPEPEPEPEPPVDDTSYYKELDAYKEVEETEEMPVDVEVMMDEDRDGTPEYYDDIRKETEREVEVDDYTEVNTDGDPLYSPEIDHYEPVEADPYLDEHGSTRGGSRTENLTHWQSIVNREELIDNGTNEIMAYDSDAVNAEGMEAFGKEVSQVGIILENMQKLQYINGSNSTDKNNDSHPEEMVTWKAILLEDDTNNDNITDHKVAAVEIIRLWDNNSNGEFEHTKALRAAKLSWDNNTDGHFEDVKAVTAAGDEAKVDGNITDHYKKVGMFYNHTVDVDLDGIYEMHRAAVYFQEYFDNNSNGHFELGREFAGGIETHDVQSNGVSESLLLVWAGKELVDYNDDGNPDLNNTILWVYGYENPDEDGIMDVQTMFMMLNQSYDNNSNGHYEDVKDVIAAYKVTDNNSDGRPEKKDAVFAVVQKWDRNDDGEFDSESAVGTVFLWTDQDGDGVPEYQKALFYFAHQFDNNSNGHFEVKHQLIAGYSVEDPDSDGIENKVFAVHYGVGGYDTNDDGGEDYNNSFAYVLELVDADGDGNMESKHAVFAHESKWDNNTDGVFEAVNQFIAGYSANDHDDDGNLDDESFFFIVNRTTDSNDDGNPEHSVFAIMATYREYDDEGDVSYARNVLHRTVAFDNNSNGNYEIIRAIVLGHEGFNGTPNGTGFDWEEEHVLILFDHKKDTDDDGVVDDHKFIKIEF